MASDGTYSVLGNGSLPRSLGKISRVAAAGVLAEALASVLLYAVLVAEHVAQGNALPAVGEMAREFYRLRLSSEPLMAIDLVRFALTFDTHLLQLVMFGVYLALIYVVAVAIAYYTVYRWVPRAAARLEVNDGD